MLFMAECFSYYYCVNTTVRVSWRNLLVIVVVVKVSSFGQVGSWMASTINCLAYSLLNSLLPVFANTISIPPNPNTFSFYSLHHTYPQSN